LAAAPRVAGGEEDGGGRDGGEGSWICLWIRSAGLPDRKRSAQDAGCTGSVCPEIRAGLEGCVPFMPRGPPKDLASQNLAKND
jgi:hypothetical protein